MWAVSEIQTPNSLAGKSQDPGWGIDFVWLVRPHDVTMEANFWLHEGSKMLHVLDAGTVLDESKMSDCQPVGMRLGLICRTSCTLHVVMSASILVPRWSRSSGTGTHLERGSWSSLHWLLERLACFAVLWAFVDSHHLNKSVRTNLQEAVYIISKTHSNINASKKA